MTFRDMLLRLMQLSVEADEDTEVFITSDDGDLLAVNRIDLDLTNDLIISDK